ncbi:MAG: hypothetical protein JO001_29665 [Alphaproteobacteria bacterium]|nr:hypothetical protein [Alphaproteobacteria bacterium]
MDEDGGQKRSSTVILTLVGLSVGAVAVANAFPDRQVKRNLYADRAACERDYSAAQCEAPSGGTGPHTGGSTGYFWHGPYYSSDRSSGSAASDPGPGRTGQITRTEISTRGGFGAIGRAIRGAT